MTTLDELRALLPVEAGNVAAQFPAAARVFGREPLVDGWTTDEAARALLLEKLTVSEIQDIYRYGDTAEKLAVLKALPLLPIGGGAVPLLEDALRTNDTRLVAAALGPYADHLGQAAWRQAVLKCVFMGVRLETVHRLRERADEDLAAMLRAFAAERHAAGRAMPPDAAELLADLEA